MTRTKLFVIAALLLLPALALAVGISIGPLATVAFAGSTNVSVPIALDNDEPAAVLSFELSHSGYLILTGAIATSRMPNATIEYNALNSTRTAVAVIIPGNISAGTGTIVNLKFDVNSSAPIGVYPLTISDITLLSDSGILNVTGSNQFFTVL